MRVLSSQFFGSQPEPLYSASKDRRSCSPVAMERRSSSASASFVLVLLFAVFLAACHGARDFPAEPEKPLRPQNVFGFGGFYPGPSVSWVFPGPNGVTPQVGFGGMPGSSGFPGVGGGVSPFTPGGGGGGVVGIHGGDAAAGAARKP